MLQKEKVFSINNLYGKLKRNPEDLKYVKKESLVEKIKTSNS